VSPSDGSPTDTTRAARTAGVDDIDVVTATIALAFAEDPVWGPAMGGARTSPAAKAELWRILVAGAVRHPWTRLLPNGAAVSVWIPPNATELSEDQELELHATVDRILGASAAAEFHELLKRFEDTHPRDTPHAYLSLLGTHPDHRGQGLGMALLADDLERMDGDRVPAYLESTNPANDRRYRGVGFEPVGEFRTVDEKRVITRMWRAPR
jgi:GNAT superfamily N-acetyltransferase